MYTIKPQTHFRKNIMSNKELIEKVKSALIKLANLQKADLEDTNDMTNYNESTSQIIKIRALINRNCTPDKILPIVENLQKNALAELESELPKMIAKHQMEEATNLYKEIKTDINTLVFELTDQQPSPSIAKP
ncbi:putative coiled-coil protein [Legionella longbeachae NSW150]|uniref:Putative coiled-coil protein n=2 Tax=Legionella longbeachae TaxID=450 RepID=D3HNP3_LEGLN|nr:putative coiled-coil protein [Legionella longbeachae NSW150]